MLYIYIHAIFIVYIYTCVLATEVFVGLWVLWVSLSPINTCLDDISTLSDIPLYSTVVPQELHAELKVAMSF
jgi:hypothetical protein